MNITLYFLRSSEQKILTDMLYYAARLDEAEKTFDEVPQIAMYEKYYGFTNKDLGLYALSGHELAGAAWIRLLKESDGANAYIDDVTPILSIGVKPAFRGQGIGSAMLEQLLLEAGALYDQISVSVVSSSPAVRFYERFGFTSLENTVLKSPVDGADVTTMIKALSKAPVIRPSDGYDPRRWMD